MGPVPPYNWPPMECQAFHPAVLWSTGPDRSIAAAYKHRIIEGPPEHRCRLGGEVAPEGTPRCPCTVDAGRPPQLVVGAFPEYGHHAGAEEAGYRADHFAVADLLKGSGHPVHGPCPDRAIEGNVEQVNHSGAFRDSAGRDAGRWGGRRRGVRGHRETRNQAQGDQRGRKPRG